MLVNSKITLIFALMANCTVYVAFHREGKIIPNDSGYEALHVGKPVSGLDVHQWNDASGETIADRNDIYSELTGWYWIWKNRKHEWVGTAHYRRYFASEEIPPLRKIGKFFLFFIGLKKKRHGLMYVSNPQKWRDKILTTAKIGQLLNHFDAILPQKKKFNYSVLEQYTRRHNKQDVTLTRQIINELYPDYLTAFDNIFNGSEMYSFNMFIMPWPLFDRYMQWLFGILFELEKRAQINRTDKYQKRVCAFMAERLQTVWFEKNNLKVKELPVLYFKRMKAEHF